MPLYRSGHLVTGQVDIGEQHFMKLGVGKHLHGRRNISSAHVHGNVIVALEVNSGQIGLISKEHSFLTLVSFHSGALAATRRMVLPAVVATTTTITTAVVS